MNHELVFTSCRSPSSAGRRTAARRLAVDPRRRRRPDAGRRAYDRSSGEHAGRPRARRRQRDARARALLLRVPRRARHGFDRRIYLTNEEEQTAANTFDGLGGASVAIFDNELHALPGLGRFSKENTVVQPQPRYAHGRSSRPRTARPRSTTSSTCTSARRTGREGLGPRAQRARQRQFYVFRSLDPARNSERTLTSRLGDRRVGRDSRRGAPTAAQLEAASDAVNAMTFVRPEDGAFNPTQPERALLRHDRLLERSRRRRQRARAALFAPAAPGQPAQAGDASRSSTTPTRSSRGRRHRDQPRQRGREQPLPDDQRGRHDREPRGHGREGPRRLDLALRPRQGPGRRPRRRRLDRDARRAARPAR